MSFDIAVMIFLADHRAFLFIHLSVLKLEHKDNIVVAERDTDR